MTIEKNKVAKEERDYIWEVYARHKNYLYGMAKEILVDEKLTEEVIVETSSQIRKIYKTTTNNDLGNIKCLFYVLTKLNASEKYEKTNKKRYRKKENYLSFQPQVEIDEDIKSDYRRLLTEVGNYNIKNKALLILKNINKLTDSQISKILKMSKDNVKNRRLRTIKRTLSSLSISLDNEYLINEALISHIESFISYNKSKYTEKFELTDLDEKVKEELESVSMILDFSKILDHIKNIDKKTKKQIIIGIVGLFVCLLVLKGISSVLKKSPLVQSTIAGETKKEDSISSDLKSDLKNDKKSGKIDKEKLAELEDTPIAKNDLFVMAILNTEVKATDEKIDLVIYQKDKKALKTDSKFTIIDPQKKKYEIDTEKVKEVDIKEGSVRQLSLNISDFKDLKLKAGEYKLQKDIEGKTLDLKFKVK